MHHFCVRRNLRSAPVAFPYYVNCTSLELQHDARPERKIIRIKNLSLESKLVTRFPLKQ